MRRGERARRVSGLFHLSMAGQSWHTSAYSPFRRIREMETWRVGTGVYTFIITVVVILRLSLYLVSYIVFLGVKRLNEGKGEQTICQPSSIPIFSSQTANVFNSQITQRRLSGAEFAAYHDAHSSTYGT